MAVFRMVSILLEKVRMKKIQLYKVNINNIRDIDYDPDKNRYSIIEYNSTRKEITREEFLSLLKIFRRREYNR